MPLSLFVYWELPCSWCHCIVIKCLNVVPSDSTHQCLIDTAPSQINTLVPGFQEPLAADYLLESISIHEINVFVWYECLIQCDKWHPWVALICLSWLIRVLWKSQHLLRCSLESRKPIVDFESNSHQGGQRNTLEFAFHGGRGTKCPKLGNILTRDQITYLLVFLSFVRHCTLVCVFSWIQLEWLSWFWY